MMAEKVVTSEVQISEGEQQMVERVETIFKELFQRDSVVVSTGKGKIQVIGSQLSELPDGEPAASVEMETDEGYYCAAGRNEDLLGIRVLGADDEGTYVYAFAPQALEETQEFPDWMKPVARKMGQLREAGLSLMGLELALVDNLPKVEGVSAEAALEAAVEQAVLALTLERDTVQEERIDESPAEKADFGAIARAGYGAFLAVGSGQGEAASGYFHKACLANEAFRRFLKRNGRAPGINDLARGPEIVDHDEPLPGRHGRTDYGMVYQDWRNMGVTDEARLALQFFLEEQRRAAELAAILGEGDVEKALDLINESGISMLTRLGVADACPEVEPAVEAMPELISLVMSAQSYARAGRPVGLGWSESCLVIDEELNLPDLKEAFTREYADKIQFADIHFGQGSRVLKHQG